ncbi:hypothetical protein GCK32_016291 [Trichostrongylus colubriformis]|uniref:Uncharacterized protein n=1 Tax=Trichostrongylus colubriformis TaxID=6319 RepID=A0AAN8EZ70_TRICO
MFAFLAVLFAVSLLTQAQNADVLSRAVGPCIGGRCQPGHTCYLDQCIPQGSRFKRNFNRDSAAGPCIDNRCPPGYFCHQMECLKQ